MFMFSMKCILEYVNILLIKHVLLLLTLQARQILDGSGGELEHVDYDRYLSKRHSLEQYILGGFGVVFSSDPLHYFYTTRLDVRRNFITFHRQVVGHSTNFRPEDLDHSRIS